MIHKVKNTFDRNMKVVGLDLAAIEQRPSGFCVFDDFTARTEILFSNVKIVNKILEVQPKLVAIDAPLSLPNGRSSLSEKIGPHMRKSEKELLKRKIRIFPITLGPMRKLTERGMALRKRLQSENIRVIEVYPGGAQDVLNIPRKKKGLDGLRLGLQKLGIKGLNDDMSDHELDAVTCALVGKLFLDGESISYGDPAEGTIEMPKDISISRK